MDGLYYTLHPPFPTFFLTIFEISVNSPFTKFSKDFSNSPLFLTMYVKNWGHFLKKFKNRSLKKTGQFYFTLKSILHFFKIFTAKSTLFGFYFQNQLSKIMCSSPPFFKNFYFYPSFQTFPLF